MIIFLIIIKTGNDDEWKRMKHDKTVDVRRDKIMNPSFEREPLECWIARILCRKCLKMLIWSNFLIVSQINNQNYRSSQLCFVNVISKKFHSMGV